MRILVDLYSASVFFIHYAEQRTVVLQSENDGLETCLRQAGPKNTKRWDCKFYRPVCTFVQVSNGYISARTRNYKTSWSRFAVGNKKSNKLNIFNGLFNRHFFFDVSGFCQLITNSDNAIIKDVLSVKDFCTHAVYRACKDSCVT